MSDTERKRTHSESSDGTEEELSKLARANEEDDDQELTDVTGRSESESSSDSGSDSESDSSSSSSSGEDVETQNCPGDQTKSVNPLNSLHVTHNDESDITNNSRTLSNSSSLKLTENFTTEAATTDLGEDKPQRSSEVRVEPLHSSEGLSLEGSGLLDEIQQFLTVTAEGVSLGSAGPVDPVFVDHEDSQHANNLDSLVFDNEVVEKFSEDGGTPSILGMENMNEPRLDSVCNSNINSAEGSLILGADFREEGELPSSPEMMPTGGEKSILDDKVVDQSSSNPADKSVQREPIRITVKLDQVSSHKKDKSRRPVEPDSEKDESEPEEKTQKKKKKTKRKKEQTKESETEESGYSPHRRSKPKRSKPSQDPPSTKCHKVSSNHSELTHNSSSLSKPVSKSCPMSVLSPSVDQTTDHIRTNVSYKPRPEHKNHMSSIPNTTPTLPHEPALPPSPTCKQLPLRDTTTQETVKQKSDSTIDDKQIATSEDNEQEKTKDSVTESPSRGGDGEKKKAKKLTLKDYKAKKEAEKQRKSVEESGSESNGSASISLSTSKEGSPEPVKDVIQFSTSIISQDQSKSVSHLAKTVVHSSSNSAPELDQKYPTNSFPVRSDIESCSNSVTSDPHFLANPTKGGVPSCPEQTRIDLQLPSHTTGDPSPSTTVDQDAIGGTSTNYIPGQSKDESMIVDNSLDVTQPVSDNDVDMRQDADDVLGGFEQDTDDVLRGFDVLDELEDNDSEDEPSKDSDDESDCLDEDEVDRMLEADVPRPLAEDKEQIEPQEKLKKLVLEERGGNVFEVLPLGWVSVTHNSGIPLYLHRETRVVSTSRPYDLGNGSVRKHNIPISAIPCYSYRYYSQPSVAANTTPTNPSSTSTEPITTIPAGTCPYSGAGDDQFTRENVSPDSTTDGGISSVQQTETTTQEGGNVFPKAQIETIEETMRKTELNPEEVTRYCKKVFVFKELEVAKFKTWKERRAYYKQSQKNKLEKELTNRPTLPEGTKIITIPSLEMSNIPGTDGDSAINQKVVKKTKKKWIINPVGKSMVCLLHEYVQQSLKMQPYYTFTELDNAATPYCAVVHINKIEYGRGTGSSKKIAKSEAARRTLEMLIPEIKDKLPQTTPGTKQGGEDGTEGPDLSFFDDIKVEDPRVADLCNRTSEPAPYQILVTCLQRNYGLGDTHINQELKAVRNGKNEYTMKVDKREVSVICKNKKDGKQLAAAKLLQQLHPHISSWGSLLRMYGNRSIRKLKIKKDKETEVTGLQSRSNQSAVAPSMAILEKLKEEMRNMREIKKSIAPIGKFLPPMGVGQTGLNTDHVDL